MTSLITPKLSPRKNKRNILTQAEHDKWFTKMGVSTQLAEKKKANGGKSPHCQRLQSPSQW